LIANVGSLAAVAAAVVIRLVLDPLLNDSVLFITVYSALGFAAWYGGRGPGLLALIAGAVAGVFVLLPPHHSFAIDQSEHQLGFVLYGWVGLAAIAMFASLRDDLRRAQEQRRVLVLEVASHRATRQSFAQQAAHLRTTLASIGDAVITTDNDTRITDTNDPAELPKVSARRTTSITLCTPREMTFPLMDRTTTAVRFSPGSRQ